MDKLRLTIRNISDADLDAILADYPTVSVLNVYGKELANVDALKDLKNFSELMIEADKVADFFTSSRSNSVNIFNC